MRSLLATAVVFLLLAAGTASASLVPPFPRLAGAWSYAKINVTIRGIPHTFVLDRGRIVQASASQLTLRERDGSYVVVRLSLLTIVRVDGVLATVRDLRRRMVAETMRIDGGAAVRVRATSF